MYCKICLLKDVWPPTVSKASKVFEITDVNVTSTIPNLATFSWKVMTTNPTDRHQLQHYKGRCIWQQIDTTYQVPHSAAIHFKSLTWSLVLESSFPAGCSWIRSTTNSFLKETPIISSSSRPWRKVTTRLAKMNFPKDRQIFDSLIEFCLTPF